MTFFQYVTTAQTRTPSGPHGAVKYRNDDRVYNFGHGGAHELLPGRQLRPRDGTNDMYQSVSGTTRTCQSVTKGSLCSHRALSMHS